MLDRTLSAVGYYPMVIMAASNSSAVHIAALKLHCLPPPNPRLAEPDPDDAHAEPDVDPGPPPLVTAATAAADETRLARSESKGLVQPVRK